eukprot:CAMPEP_0198446254 /NCGR_PEP_ID=MMETSP1453-20131121/1185_1 /TAXON_ID=1461543 ORGANISM="Unidentified sp., Strain RCC701" /NCGR_SAMPLE_ID=MMETSP1453 /ASSEMBLY_ACC=CAM_ASM_001118 /LENGTH=50 /DNA_ID=CAMNT_0044167289 /DNA_START=12 /DNA_END=164 /DNA_ORIENTATION=+
MTATAAMIDTGKSWKYCQKTGRPPATASEKAGRERGEEEEETQPVDAKDM